MKGCKRIRILTGGMHFVSDETFFRYPWRRDETGKCDNLPLCSPITLCRIYLYIAYNYFGTAVSVNQ